MKRAALLIGLLFCAGVVVTASRHALMADAGQSTPTASPAASGTPVPIQVRSEGLFPDGVHIRWEAVPNAASFSVQGNEDWLAVRQGEGICVLAGAPQVVQPIPTNTPIAGTTTTYVILLPQQAPPVGLIWWPSHTTFQITAMDQQGRQIGAGALNEPGVSFGPCPDATAVATAVAIATPTLSVQLPNTGTGLDSY
jgi:hypothetical protein